MSSVSTHHMLHTDQRPERSRNAKAQARHRAKRKAYIEQLEQTVTKLQTALGYTPEELEAMPPPLVKIRELEQENARLEKENEDFRRMLADSGRNPPPEIPRRAALSPFQDTRPCDHNFKRRKMLGNIDGPYLHGSENSPQHTDHVRPPPLTIPQQPISHHYSYVPPSSSTQSIQGNGSMFNLHAPTFQIPSTPSSSATSSPPFSPAPMHGSLQPPPSHRSSSTQMMTNYTHPHRQHQYDSVKPEGEDERYSSNHQSSHHNGHGQYESHSTHTYANEPISHVGHASIENQWHNTYDSRSAHNFHR